MQKTGSVGAEVMLCGRLFQSRLPATGKARSPMVTSRVDRTVSRVDDDERRHRRLVSVRKTERASCLLKIEMSKDFLETFGKSPAESNEPEKWLPKQLHVVVAKCMVIPVLC